MAHAMHGTPELHVQVPMYVPAAARNRSSPIWWVAVAPTYWYRRPPHCTHLCLLEIVICEELGIVESGAEMA